MKYFVNILFLISFWSCFSQNDFPEAPKECKKIHFVYERKCNFYFDDKGIYADTTLCRIEFPGVKLIKTNHPKDGSQCGFISFSSMDEKAKKSLKSDIYHAYESYVGTYDVKRNETTIKALRYDPEVKKLFNNVFNESYSKFSYTIYIDYKKKIKTLEFPAVTYEIPFYEEQTEIYLNSDTVGYCYVSKAKIKNDVSLNQNLSKYITLGYIFANNDFGLEKMSSLYQTVQLKSVTYE